MSARGQRLAFLLCGLVGIAAQAQTGHGQASFGISVEYVQVDVLVSSNGKPVTGLTAENFELRDSGVRRAVELVSAEQAGANVLLALDVSQSLQAGRLRALQAAAVVLLRGLQPRDRAGLVVFNHALQVLAPLGAPATAERALRALHPFGATALLDGLYLTLSVANAQDAPAVVVLFTDGLDTLSWLRQEELSATARRSNATLYVVSPSAVTRSLRTLVHDSGGQVFAADWNGLAQAFGEIGDHVRHRYRLRFEPGAGAQGWHALDVQLKGTPGDVRARRGYVRNAPTR